MQVLDEEVLERLVIVNDDARSKGMAANQGVRLKLFDPSGKQLFFGDVHPNVQYEYEAEEAGKYMICAQLTEQAFFDDYQQVKTKVKFSAEFHRSKYLVAYSLLVDSLIISFLSSFQIQTAD